MSGVRTRAHVCAHRRAAAASIRFAERPVSPPPHPALVYYLARPSVRSFRFVSFLGAAIKTPTTSLVEPAVRLPHRFVSESSSFDRGRKSPIMPH